MAAIAVKAAPTRTRFDLAPVLRLGLVGGIVALLISLIGIIQASLQRAVISPFLSLGQTILLLMYVAVAVMTVRRMRASSEAAVPSLWMIVGPALAGLIVSLFLAALVLLGQVVNLKNVLIQANAALWSLLTFNLPVGPGLAVLLVAGAAVGALVGGLFLVPARIRQALVLGLGLIPLVAIVASGFFSSSGLSVFFAIAIFVVGAGGSYLWSRVQGRVKGRIAALPKRGQRAYRLSIWAAVAAVVLLLPLTGAYPSQVLDTVGLYVLMGLGLNIVVGFAGLLDLGYVAFFALGAYTMGVLTSPETGWLGFHMGFWPALPFTVLVGVLAGVLLGIPVLGMRGDYLAIVTLGFGEIIRIVALSDWLKPYIGGSNGITQIPRPAIGPLSFASQGSLYYLIIAFILVAAFVATRVKDSRLGRAWMAVREDEDVAQAMGIDLVRTKLLAFAAGAAFSGLAGAFFGTMIASIYPHSFTLLISINVLAVIIVGGMGSIPGVVIGAFALAGLPELLREFSDYRLWVFGAALVLMMLTRPAGVWPEARRKLEMQQAEDTAPEQSGDQPAAVAS